MLLLRKKPVRSHTRFSAVSFARLLSVRSKIRAPERHSSAHYSRVDFPGNNNCAATGYGLFCHAPVPQQRPGVAEWRTDWEVNDWIHWDWGFGEWAALWLGSPDRNRRGWAMLLGQPRRTLLAFEMGESKMDNLPSLLLVFVQMWPLVPVAFKAAERHV